MVLASLVWHSGHAGTVDREVNTTLYARPGSVGRSAWSAITVLGSPAVVIVVALAVGIWTWARTRDRLLAVFCPAAVTCAALAETLIKAVVDRARPATASAAHVHGTSFPSGHATVSAALALAVALVLVAAGRGRWRLGRSLLAAYAATIALSRIILGVHYLTDVIAGAALGTGIVLVLAGAWPGAGGRRREQGAAH